MYLNIPEGFTMKFRSQLISQVNGVVKIYVSVYLDLCMSKTQAVSMLLKMNSADIVHSSS